MPATTSSHKLLFGALAGAGVIVAAMVVVAVAIVATGRGGTPRAIGLTNIPMIPGARVLTKVRSCDRGVNPYCSVQVVIVGDQYPTSQALQIAYADQLRRLGWTTTTGPDGKETSADSPGHELRLTFATAYEDLRLIDLGWIQRRAPISRSLSATLFRRARALSIMLVTGSS